ncbi:pitrilysin family protein [Gracilibacillus sp. YIM 98692]|uniref:EF-P 5-aminopentanol modification-associated protein YfmF n=1 Tax=Gracilibacillus sp. YIM 98692 TaxID=2663532 RepID=UPI0013D6FB99|nr:pitrilysin family protein [Gracilibacillus sp. YIM 98692]
MEHITREDGYHLHLLHTKKFKTLHICLKFVAPLERNSITKRALIPYILQQGTAEYPNAIELRQQLDLLYGAVLHIDGSKKGEHHITTVRLEIANEQYIANQSHIIDDAVQLLKEIIYHPKVENGAFDSNVVEREKQTLLQKIRALKEDKISLANTRLIEEMCEGEPYHLRVHGYEEDLADLSAGELYNYYQQMLAEDQLDVYVVGDIENMNMKNKIAQLISKERQSSIVKTDPTVPERPSDTIVEKDQVQQAKLHFGYRTGITYDDPNYAALHVFNGIFGGFPSSKLFTNVREKHSLAYYAASRLESHKGLLFVFSGIAPDQYDRARDIILEQMEQMRKGEFSEDDIAETKEMAINQLKETLDNPQGMIELHYQKVIGQSDKNVEQLIKEIQQVTKQHIIQVAEAIQLDKVYLLTSEEAE